MYVGRISAVSGLSLSLRSCFPYFNLNKWLWPDSKANSTWMYFYQPTPDSPWSPSDLIQAPPWFSTHPPSCSASPLHPNSSVEFQPLSDRGITARGGLAAWPCPALPGIVSAAPLIQLACLAKETSAIVITKWCILIPLTQSDCGKALMINVCGSQLQTFRFLFPNTKMIKSETFAKGRAFPKRNVSASDHVGEVSGCRTSTEPREE